MAAAEFPPVQELVAHRPPVLLLDEVLAHAGDSSSLRVDIASQTWLTRADGSVSAWLAVEYMAQAVAAHEGLVALAEGRPLPVGFLVSVAGLRLRCTHFAQAARLRVDARRIRGRPGLGVLSHQCSLSLDSPTGAGSEQSLPSLAEGRLTVSLPRHLQPGTGGH